MTRLLRPFLLFMAVLGLFGQSTAMAMSPAQGVTMPMTAMATMDCGNSMMSGQMHGSMPCKKMTLQCIAVMGCAIAPILQPVGITLSARQLDLLTPAWTLTARLEGRTYGPEPDPPSFLI
ncbi:MAG: hypothetical protein EOP66_06330 [Sphingomonas sp.]|uniref:hypothetical protein n=1 Tax=Sphingomonas sp. BAUL-RG-20F-R05-02 TaxID=2914830 RepID=UPI00121C9F98|nr:hypothetical protein [Sphingomonas sp. BAUL-RG-20F-R05-02]RZL80699.1 MAG: hypothetical protein EOP66_06330 [Sphingomonas sp.]